MQNPLYMCSQKLWLFSAGDCWSWVYPLPFSECLVAFYPEYLSDLSAAPWDLIAGTVTFGQVCCMSGPSSGCLRFPSFSLFLSGLLCLAT